MKKIIEIIKNNKYLLLTGLVIMLIVIVPMLYNETPQTPQSPVYKTVEEPEEIYPGKASLLDRFKENSEGSSEHALWFVFDTSVDISNLKVSVVPEIKLKIAQYSDKNKIFILPDGTDTWKYGSRYKITVDNKDKENPELEKKIVFVHYFYYPKDLDSGYLMFPGESAWE